MLLRRWVVLVVSIMVAAALVSPAGAGGGFAKKFDKQVKKKLSKAGTINAKKNPVNWTRLKNVPAGLAGGFDACADGSAIQSLSLDGSVECEVGAVGGGDITGVLAGMGLTGGGDEGEVTLAADTSVLQARVDSTCGSNGVAHAVLKAINQDGTVECNEDLIDGVTAGEGLTGGGQTGAVTLGVDPTQVQARVGGSCVFGGGINTIDQNGAVTCTPYVWEDLEIVTASSASNATDFKAVTATCPVGKKVIGGGASVTGFLVFTVALFSSYPSGNNSWAAGAAEFSATSASWGLTAYAICAQTELPL